MVALSNQRCLVILILFTSIFINPIYTTFALSSLQAETIKIGVDREAAPMEFEEQGQPMGFNIDIFDQVSASWETQNQYLFMEWPDVLESVSNGSLDAMFAINTEERREVYDFSDPFLNISWRIFIREEQPKLNSITDLENHTVAVIKNFAADQYLQSLSFHFHIVEVEDTEEGLSLLSKGEVYAYFGNYHLGLYYVQQEEFNNIIPTGEEMAKQEMCIAVKKGNSVLLSKINLGLQLLFESGNYTQLYNSWFGGDVLPEINPTIIQITSIVIGGLFVVLILLAVWNFTLTKKIEEKTEDLKKTNRLLMRQDKIESIGVLAGGIAHDFNNFLTSILGNISLAKLEIGEENKDLFEILQEAENASINAKDLTQQLLTFSKGGKPIKKVINIAPIIQHSSVFALHGTDISLSLDIAEDIWPASVDEGQITQVINNIVINAKQAMEKGGKIKITAQNKEEPVISQTLSPKKKYIEIKIQDQGIGIPEKNIPKIFDPYFTTKPTGNGLGLSICYNIIKNHNGEILVQSAQMKGTTFTIYLPASDKPIENLKNTEGKLIQGCGKVIVMDDQRGIRTLLKLMLTKLGFEVETSIDGEDAIQRFEQSKLESSGLPILILDITIPGGMGGIETLKILKKTNPKIKAIISSGYSNIAVMSDYKKYGFLGVLPKPFSLMELSNLLKEILE
ncbi:transporter substrate-binding domain-containing protein [Candidatus Lokiarchaeum ossiferum]|uniref:transporter substrate-binding domain-containing protein n=1 Tax=Candidatus Lokiarchaeum ossiferum TaxID=2951803 RepID=UPI00352F6102